MDPITLLFFGVGLAIVVYMYLSSQKTAPVAAEHQIQIPDGGLNAIEYFWRPG